MSTRMVQINPQVYTALQSHISEHVSLKAQGEIGAKIQEMILLCKQCYKQILKVHKIEIASMIANRVATLTIELSTKQKNGSKTRSISNVKTKRIRFKSYGHAK